jgi:hypothetical protein
MVAKALSLPMFPKSKRSDLSDTLKRYLHAQSHWMTDAEVRDVCGACLALRAQRVDIVATSVCLWLRRASLRPPSPAQLCLLLTMMAAWRRRSAMRLWIELYTPHVAAHVLAFCPSPVPASVLSALEQLLLPLSELADRDEAGDEDDDEEAAAEAAAAAAAAAAVTQTTHATDQPVFDVADVIVAADAHAIVAAPVNAIVLGPVEFPTDHIAGPADGASTAAASAAAATITTTTTEDVIAEAIDQWAVKHATATATATATVAAAEAEDVADEEVVRDTPRNAAIVQLVHRVFRPQIAMLLLQRCPHYTGSLLLPPPAAGAGAGAGAGPSPRSAQEMGDAMVDALTALVARARKVADADGEGQGDGAGGETTTTTTTTTSPDEGDHCSEWTGEDQFKVLCQYLGQGLVVDGFSPAQLTRLFSAIASVMTDPEQYTAECCDTATRCCIDIVDRGQLPGHCVSLVMQAAITATRRDPSGTNRQGLCWLLDQLVERYQPAMTSEDIDTLIEFFASRVYTAPREAMMATTAAAAAAAATTAHTDVSPATAAGGAETFPSARQNSFVGLIKLVDGSQTHRRCPLTRAQLKRIRDVLVECLCWDSVTFADMNQTERDEVRVLLSGEIVATLNRLIAATAATAAVTAGSP